MTARAKPQQPVSRFLRHVAPWTRRSGNKYLSFLGVLAGNHVALCLSRVWLNAQMKMPVRQIHFGSYIAGTIELADFNCTAHELVQKLFVGKEARTGDLRFSVLVDEGKAPTSVPENFEYEDNQLIGSRLAILSALGGPIPQSLFSSEIDWLLRAQVEPYDSLAELLMELGLPTRLPGICKLDVVALGAIEVLRASNGGWRKRDGGRVGAGRATTQ